MVIDFFSIFLIAVISYLGLIAGIILMFVAPEEKKPGLKYFRWISRGIFYFGALLILFFSFNISSIIFSIAGIIIFFIIQKKLGDFFLGVFAYGYLPISIFFGYDNIEFLVAFFAVIFAYGLCQGAVICDPKRKKKSLLNGLIYAYFIVLSVVFYLIGLKIFS